jgi:hypothetical protein
MTATPDPLPSPTMVGQCDIIGVVPDVHGSSENIKVDRKLWSMFIEYIFG